MTNHFYVTKNSENKPQGLYFSKALFEELIFRGAYIERALCTEGNLCFKIDWASLLWKGNLPFLLCFTLYSRANSKYKPPGGLYWHGDLTEGFLRYSFGGDLYLEGLIHGGAYFQNFTVYSCLPTVLFLVALCMNMLLCLLTS